MMKSDNQDSMMTRSLLGFAVFFLGLGFLIRFHGRSDLFTKLLPESAMAVSADVLRMENQDRRAPSNTLLYSHDFGFTRSGTVQSHVFRVKNETPRPWRVERVSTSCSCTIAEATRRVVKTGDFLEVEVQYQAPKLTTADRRSAFVKLKGNDVPNIKLEIAAAVFEAMTVDEDRLQSMEVGKGRTRSRKLVVYNYGEKNWSQVRVESAAQWLDASTFTQTLSRSLGFEPRQAWQTEVLLNANEMLSGEHSGDLKLMAIGPDGSPITRKLVRVGMRVVEPVRCVPRHIFFGEVPESGSSRQTVYLTFSKDVVPSGSECFRVRHSYGDALTYRWQRASESVWKLQCKLTNSTAIPREQQVVRIEFLEFNLPDIELPVHAFSSTPSQGLERSTSNS